MIQLLPSYRSDRFFRSSTSPSSTTPTDPTKLRFSHRFRERISKRQRLYTKLHSSSKSDPGRGISKRITGFWSTTGAEQMDVGMGMDMGMGMEMQSPSISDSSFALLATLQISIRGSGEGSGEGEGEGEGERVAGYPDLGLEKNSGSKKRKRSSWGQLSSTLSSNGQQQQRNSSKVNSPVTTTPTTSPSNHSSTTETNLRKQGRLALTFALRKYSDISNEERITLANQIEEEIDRVYGAGSGGGDQQAGYRYRESVYFVGGLLAEEEVGEEVVVKLVRGELEVGDLLVWGGRSGYAHSASTGNEEC